MRRGEFLPRGKRRSEPIADQQFYRFYKADTQAEGIKGQIIIYSVPGMGLVGEIVGVAGVYGTCAAQVSEVNLNLLQLDASELSSDSFCHSSGRSLPDRHFPCEPDRTTDEDLEVLVWPCKGTNGNIRTGFL